MSESGDCARSCAHKASRIVPGGPTLIFDKSALLGPCGPPCGVPRPCPRPPRPAHTPLGVSLCDRHVEPAAKHMQHRSVTHPSRDRHEQLHLQNRVEVPGQVRINDVGIAGAKRLMYRCHRLPRAAPRSVSVHGVGIVCLKDRRQHQHRRGLDGAVADGRNPQGALPDAAALWATGALLTPEAGRAWRRGHRAWPDSDAPEKARVAALVPAATPPQARTTRAPEA